MKKGFTLIELLAVIVILAIIALIAVPIVLGIINDSKKSSEKEGIKLYLDTVTKTIARQNLKGKYEPDKCNIQSDENIECFSGETSLGILNIDMKGKTPTEGTIYFNRGKVNTVENIKYDGLFYQMSDGVISNGTSEKVIDYSKYITLVSDASPSGISYGDKYTYKVNDTDTFNFYVLAVEGDTVHLIMDSNICNDGTIPTSSKPCTYAWHWQTQESDENDNRYGPDIAMINLYNGTKGWINVPDMIMDYDDENNKTDDTKGYTSIITSNGVTTITGKPTTNTTTVGTSSKPLKARLPKESEVTGAGCTTGVGSCPMWLVKNLKYWNGANNKYSDNQNNGITNIYGYWLLSSTPGSSDYSNSARNVHRFGNVNDNITSYASYSGLRPVITVSLSDLSS